MVGLHVVDDQIVELAVADHLADIGFEPAAECLLDGVDECGFLACDQVGVVRYSLGERPEPFEAGCGPVVDADIVDAGCYFRD